MAKLRQVSDFKPRLYGWKFDKDGRHLVLWADRAGTNTMGWGSMDPDDQYSLDDPMALCNLGRKK